MAQLTIFIGTVLILLGIGGYVLTDMVSPTALIPAAFGLVMVMLGVYGRSPGHRRTAMHLAMGVAAIGMIGTHGGLVDIVHHGGAIGGPDGAGAASLSKASMSVVLLVYLGLGIRSFLKARTR